METFPSFMKNIKNRIADSQQHTEDIEGYFFEGNDGSQMAFWECRSDKVSSRHTHDFDEYILCVSGEYIAYVNDEAIVLTPGCELHIPKGVEQWGKCRAGTRTIHAFGGNRIKSR